MPKYAPPLIIIDSSYLCHAAKHSMGGLSYGEQKTGVIYEFLRRILSLSNRFHTRDFVFAWDSSYSFRRELFPEYKQKRIDKKAKRTSEEVAFDNSAYAQFTLLRKHILIGMGFHNTFIRRGYEADDIIASVAETECLRSDTNRDIIIVSRDHDLLQVLGPGVKLFDPKDKKMITESDFRKKYGMEPQTYVSVLCLAGCHTDNVPGIKGVGEETALKYLKRKLKEDSAVKERILAGNDIIKRNWDLVNLPFPGLKFINLVQNEVFKYSDFTDVFEEYGFQSFLRNPLLRQWKTAFRL